MPFDLVAIAYKEVYINSLLTDEECKKQLIEQQLKEKYEGGNYREELDEEALTRVFGGVEVE